ncbi:MAG: hypothetical protein AAB515_03160 [Patescibacteria group bacterium]
MSLITRQGRERLLIKKGAADKAFVHRDARNERAVVEKTLYDEYELAQQPCDWHLYAAKVLHSKLPGTHWEHNCGDLLAKWERAVTSHVSTAQREIAGAISGHAILGAPLPAVYVYIVGKGELRLHQCPLPFCFGREVAYRPADAASFATTMLERLRRIPPLNQCNHTIPVPASAQKILGNYLEIYRARR